MGIIDYFNSRKKEKQKIEGLKTKYLHTAKTMKCDINSMSPIDWLAMQSFLFSTHDRKSDYINGNNVCMIDTAIYSCFVLLTICKSNISNDKKIEEFTYEFINKFKFAISDYFHFTLSHTLEIIENRLKIYNNAVEQNYDLNDVNFEFEKIILNDIVYNEIQIYDESIPYIIVGLHNSTMCQMEISAYYSSLISMCDELISSVIVYINNSH